MMRAIHADGAGGADVLRWGEADAPSAGPGEVLVAVVAAGVNRADVMQREGHYPPPPGASPILGLECSGRIVALGEGVTGWAEGDPVCALLSGGGYAERVAVPAGQLLPIPAGISLQDAAALPETACTVWSNLVMIGGLQAGETLLVHGGGSGIGTTAIQIGRAIGARVAATAGSAAKLAVAEGLGATIAIDYKTEDFAARMQAEGGADLILDIIGGKYLAQNVQILKRDGRIVTIGLQGGRKGELDLGALLMKRGRIMGTSLRSLPAERKAAVVAAVRENVWPMIADGRFRPVIDRMVPMAEAAEAHRLMESGAITGKVLLAC